MEEIGSIKADDASQIQEIYLQPDSGKLVLVCSRFDALEDEDYPSGRGFYNTQSVEAITYDVGMLQRPRRRRVTQSGNYSSSRMADGCLYLFSGILCGPGTERASPGHSSPGEWEVIANDDIYLPPVPQANMYEVITSVDLNHPGRQKDSKAIFFSKGRPGVCQQREYLFLRDTVGISEGRYYDGP